ncbi:MAG: hypothetical protein ACTSYD_10220 [Candidatus Heimdallarchaeaceae archaeon]
MSLLSFLNSYCKKLGIILMVSIPVVIIGLLISIDFNPTFGDPLTWVIVALWVYLMFNAILYSFNAILLSRNFFNSVARRAEEGFPLDAIEGFTAIRKKFSVINRNSMIISFSAMVSLATFLAGLLAKFSNEESRQFFQFLAIGLVLITVGIVLIIRFPQDPAVKPGGLIGFYLPSKVPSVLDNLLSDTAFAYLDPVTRIKWDDWTAKINSILRPDFEADEDNITRIERAREKMLLLLYLHRRMPKVITDSVIEKELSEIMDEKSLQSFLQGTDSEISKNVLLRLIDILIKETPEVFALIDQLIVVLRDNLNEFKKKSLYTRISIPQEVTGKKPFQVLVFIVNNDPAFREQKRPISILYKADRSSFFPYDETFPIMLDVSEDLELDGIDTLPLYDPESKDILEVLSILLQVGDAYWFQVQPKTYGNSIISVQLEENNRIISGTHQQIKIKRDIMYYITNYGSKLSFLGGFATPVIKYIQNLLS